MVDVELDREHYDVAINKALQKYRQLSSGAVEESMICYSIRNAGVIVVAQFLFVIHRRGNREDTNIYLEGFKNYMIQILNFITYQADEKPFPFNEFPKSEDNL